MEAVYSIGNQGRIMRRLLGRPTIESSHDPAITSSPLATQYRPSASQNSGYQAGVPIGCLDRSPNGNSAILGGRHILKTVNFDGLVIKEGIDLRALLLAQSAPKSNNSFSISDQLSIKDVKWGTGQASSTVFTACASGKIFQYDLTRIGSNAAGGKGIDFIQMREDSRQINALDINPHRATWLLSGSQDGYVRCFDLRMPTQARTGLTFRAVQSFKCNADGVRQVKWSPKEGFVFACGTEQGVVLKWDIRKAPAPVLRINAHDKTCSAIAWHPDGDHLISAGWDSRCHIWDMSKTADKRQKPKWSISTPAPVATVAWRPGQWSATAQGKRASQIAVSYDESSYKRHGISSVHIWDLARPTMPYRELQRSDSSPNALLWHDQYLLWTAGQDGLFNQCDVTFAPKLIDRQAVSTMAFSSRGDVLMFLDERAPSHRPRPHILHPEVTPMISYSSSPATPRFGVSRSDSEDDVIGSFLGPGRRGSSRKRRSARAAANLSTTPPTGPGLEEVLSLEQTIKVTGIYKPQQAMAIGHVPSAADVDVYEYLSVNYLETLYRELPRAPGGKPIPDRVAGILEHYAKAAEKVKHFRLAQTWRILAYGIDLVLRRRAQYHFELRMESLRTSFTKKKSETKAKSSGQLLEMSLDLAGDGEITPRKVMSSSSLDTKLAYSMSLISKELESTSNVPTPLARPVSDDGIISYHHERGKKLTPIIEPESFTLPPSLHARALGDRKRLDSEPLSTSSHDSETTRASTEGYDFYDADALVKAINVPGSPSRARKPIIRQDSDDSFAQVFSISHGSRHATGLTNSSDGSITAQAAIRAAFMDGPQNASASDDGDFGSRIRGRQIEGSPTGFPFRRMLERTDTNMSAFTDEHNLITQTTSDSFGSPYPSQTDADFSTESPQRQPRPPAEPVDPEKDFRSPFMIETDYLSWANDPPYPYPLQSASAFSTNGTPPLQPYSLISRALAFETKSSALNASAIVLLLKPLVPADVIDNFQTAAILRQHHSRLMSLKLSVEASLLRKMCMRGWPGGVLSSWGENYPAVFTPAHQGVQVGFFCAECRKPREIDRTSGSTQSIWHCGRCKSVMAPCAVCGHRDSPPDIPLPPYTSESGYGTQQAKHGEEETMLATWWHCPGCGHGGHSSCLQAWHSAFESDFQLSDTPLDGSIPLESSDGCCPLDGCGHACLPGRGRVDSVAARTDEVTRALREAARGASRMTPGMGAGIDMLLPSQGGGIDRLGELHQTSGSGGEHRDPPHGVRSDGYDVPQSRAVESVRETLTNAGQGHHIPVGSAKAGLTTTTSILSSSPGRSGERMERERRKSVKFVATPEER
ncbi:hypothetical protein B0H67DRAFT_566398 [Lasiosphaeris hirsuta]|uniref:WD repeat-containing protein n=1 Tax=Lasiosphaeris hirsuta TaxID=260670 RepID=A0AA40BD17_9PEZI|nr:hypothetical protein B0H67DRAFT_566398 [Lasiosphaeris hirsuta]